MTHEPPLYPMISVVDRDRFDTDPDPDPDPTPSFKQVGKNRKLFRILLTAEPVYIVLYFSSASKMTNI